MHPVEKWQSPIGSLKGLAYLSEVLGPCPTIASRISLDLEVDIRRHLESGLSSSAPMIHEHAGPNMLIRLGPSETKTIFDSVSSVLTQDGILLGNQGEEDGIPGSEIDEPPTNVENAGGHSSRNILEGQLARTPATSTPAQGTLHATRVSIEGRERLFVHENDSMSPTFQSSRRIPLEILPESGGDALASSQFLNRARRQVGPEADMPMAGSYRRLTHSDLVHEHGQNESATLSLPGAPAGNVAPLARRAPSSQERDRGARIPEWDCDEDIPRPVSAQDGAAGGPRYVEGSNVGTRRAHCTGATSGAGRCPCPLIQSTAPSQSGAGLCC